MRYSFVALNYSLPCRFCSLADLKMNFYAIENRIVIMKDYIGTAESTERVRGVKFGVKIVPHELAMLHDFVNLL